MWVKEGERDGREEISEGRMEKKNMSVGEGGREGWGGRRSVKGERKGRMEV